MKIWDNWPTLILIAVVFMGIIYRYHPPVGLCLILAAIVIGYGAAMIERPGTMGWSYFLSLMCGLMTLAAAWFTGLDFDLLARAWGRDAAQGIIWLFWLSGGIITVLAVFNLLLYPFRRRR